MNEEPEAVEPVEEVIEAIPPRILATPNAAHPKVEIISVSPARGVAKFRWLTADETPVDGGNSLARFTAVEPVEETDEETGEVTTSYPEPGDGALVTAIETPPAGDLATPAQIKAEAHRRILAIVPMWKQNNLTAVALDIKTKDAPTAEDTATLAAIQGIWNRVKAIRAYSNILESNPPPINELASKDWPE